MVTHSRLINSLRNSSVNVIVEFINNLINFGIRTIFIYYLSVDYLGLNGLFNNILNFLNLAELGFGTAITYNLYKPVADDDKERIKSLVKLYKVIYRVIGLSVMTLGLLVIPFMGYLEKDAVSIEENIVLLYLLYLAQIVGSYLFGYKRNVFLVYQQDYLNKLVDFILNIIKAVLQIVILVMTKDYVLYLFIFIATTILSNVVIAIMVDKRYPFLRDKDVKDISREELKEIFKNVKSLFVYKIGTAIQNGTDNILLTIFVGLSAVGIYSNYNTVVLAVNKILWALLTGLKGSIGNLNAKETNERKEEILLEVNLISNYFYGVFSVCMMVLLNPFIVIWIGEEYLFPIGTVILIVLCIFLRGIEFPMITYRETLGLFKEGRMAPIAMVIVNIILSIIFGNLYGAHGIFLATVLSMCTTTLWYNPYILYKKRFNKSPRKYYLNSLYYFVSLVMIFLVCYNVDKLIPLAGIGGFIVRGIVAFGLSNILMLALIWKKQEFKEIKRRAFNLIKRKL